MWAELSTPRPPQKPIMNRIATDVMSRDRNSRMNEPPRFEVTASIAPISPNNAPLAPTEKCPIHALARKPNAPVTT